MHITGEIDQVGGGQLTAPEDAAIYLINFNGHAALVDAGCGRALPPYGQHPGLRGRPGSD